MSTPGSRERPLKFAGAILMEGRLAEGPLSHHSLAPGPGDPAHPKGARQISNSHPEVGRVAASSPMAMPGPALWMGVSTNACQAQGLSLHHGTGLCCPSAFGLSSARSMPSGHLKAWTCLLGQRGQRLHSGWPWGGQQPWEVGAHVHTSLPVGLRAKGCRWAQCLTRGRQAEGPGAFWCSKLWEWGWENSAGLGLCRRGCKQGRGSPHRHTVVLGNTQWSFCPKQGTRGAQGRATSAARCLLAPQPFPQPSAILLSF